MSEQAILEKHRKVRQVLWAILIANWTIAAIKLGIGLWSNAAAVTADALHGFIDGASNIVGLVGMSIAAQPADDDHPYGHGKFEALASLAIGVLVGAAMLELGKMAFGSLFEHRHAHVDYLMIALMVGTLVANLVVTATERRVGRRISSSILLADSRHTLSDVYVTGSVLVSLVLIKLGFPRADGIAALVVMVFVAHTAYEIIQQAVSILSDSVRLNPNEVSSLVAKTDGVQRCTSVRSRGMEGAVYVDLKIEVDPLLPTAAAHFVADQVERKLFATFPEIIDVVVHVEPGDWEPLPSPAGRESG